MRIGKVRNKVRGQGYKAQCFVLMAGKTQGTGAREVTAASLDRLFIKYLQFLWVFIYIIPKDGGCK